MKPIIDIVTLAQATETPVAAPVRIKEDFSTVARTVDKYFDMIVEFSPRIIGALLILALAWFISSWARRTIDRTFNRPEFDRTLVKFFSTAAKWVILVVALAACLGMLGIPAASVLAVMGAAGLAIGLAIQGSLANLSAGIMLLVLRPFKVGDGVVVAGQAGRVDAIELFHTKIDSADNRRIIIPNSQIFGSVIENVTKHVVRRVDVPVAVSLSADLERTREALERAVESIDGRVATPAPAVELVGLAPGATNWSVMVWCATADMGSVKQQLVRACKVALEDASVNPALPQVEVWTRPSSLAMESPQTSQSRRLQPIEPREAPKENDLEE